MFICLTYQLDMRNTSEVAAPNYLIAYTIIQNFG